MPNFFLKDDPLFLVSKCIRPFLGQKNAYIFEVSLPPTTRLNINMFAGTLFLAGMSGDVDVSIKAGEVAGITDSQSVNIALIAGNVNLHRLTGNAYARVYIGNIALRFDKVVKESNINLRSIPGDVAVNFPNGFFGASKAPRAKGNISNAIGAGVYTSTMLSDVCIEEASELV